MATPKALVRVRGGYTALHWLGVLAVVSAPLGCSSNAASDSSTGGSSTGSGGLTSSGGLPSAGIGGGAANTGGTTAGSATGGAAPTDGGATSGGATSTGGDTDSGGTSSLGGGGGGADPGGATSSGGTSAGGAASGGGGTATGGSSNPGGPTYPYIFSNFNDAATLSSLMIYTSSDALNWTLLYDTKFTGPTGFMRDPSIMRHTDGKYYVAFTTPPTLSCCGDESSFAVASSTNLKDWTTVATIPNGVSGVKNTWAPEWFIDTDGTVHVTVTLDLKTYRYEPTDATLTKWGSGTFIGLSGTIDTQIVKIGTTYHAIIPNGHRTSTSLDGPWASGQFKPPPTCKEAPAVVHISGDTWRFYCDDGGAGHEKSSLTTDLFQTWSALTTLPVVGNNISHGTVIRGDTGHPF